MPITIDISPELEVRLQEKAEQEGVATQEFISRLFEIFMTGYLPYLSQVTLVYLDALTQKLLMPPASEPKPLRVVASRDEWERKFDEWVGSHDPNRPPLPESSTHRAFFYGDRS